MRFPILLSLTLLFALINSIQGYEFDVEWNQSSLSDWNLGNFNLTVPTPDGKVILAEEMVTGNEERDLGCDSIACYNTTTFSNFFDGKIIENARLKIDVLRTDYDQQAFKFVEYIKIDDENMGECTPYGSDCLTYHTCFDDYVTEKANDNILKIEIKNSEFVNWQCWTTPWVKIFFNWSGIGYKPSGTFESQIKDFGERVHIKSISLDINLNNQSIIMIVETSNNNFTTIKDYKTVYILNGTNNYEIENISGRYLKLKFIFFSDKSNTPELHSFSVKAKREFSWIEKIEPTYIINNILYTNQTKFRVFWNCSDPDAVDEYYIQFRIYNGTLSMWSNWTHTNLNYDIFGPNNPVEVKDGVEYHFRVRVRDKEYQYWNWSGIDTVLVDTKHPVSNFYQPELHNYTFILRWNATDNVSGIERTETQVNISGVWKSIDDICNIEFGCYNDNTLCEGMANCSFPSEIYEFRTRATDMVGNTGEWVYIIFTSCTDLDGDGFCWETNDCKDDNPKINPNATELCNGLDDDCDGKIDEGFFLNGTSMGSQCGVGICKGVWVCNENGTSIYCKANYTPGELLEICGNGLDDDCDGKIDEIEEIVNGSKVKGCFCKEGERKKCGIDIGECKKGEMVCINGTWSECKGSIDPVPEICDDGKDNDCDGKIDEDLEIINGKSLRGCICQNGRKKVCGSNIGACKTGYRICINGEWSECRGDVKPKEEICNDIDDDCDGIIDNIFGKTLVEETKCGCTDGRSPKMELCNDIDDDCDGKIDEDIRCCSNGETRKCINMKGICSTGIQTCINNTWSECSIKPSLEICGNGIDDDCDGKIDENCGRVDTTIYVIIILLGISIIFVTIVIESLSKG